MAGPRISVVVPFFNVADLLGDCLRSIAAQTFGDFEVIMVDDGSTDGSTEIARAQAAVDPRFILLQVRNGGPGYARNRGVELARGEFLGFVDGDDMVPPGAYEVLVHTLERSGSDFVCGNVNRIGPWGIRQSGLHARAIKGRRTATHITKMPQLLYDISVFNKLFRKRFWDAHRLSFPEGMLWEDLQLMTRAHVLARAVDVIPDHIYFWRERGLGELSITQSRTNISNLRDRIDALLAIDGFLAVHAPADLLRRHQRKALTNDLWLYVGDLHKVSDDYRAEFLGLAGRYLDQVRPGVLSKLPATQKLAYYLIRRRLMPQLLELLTWQLRQPVRTVPLVHRRGRLLADLPLRTDSRLRIPAKIFRPYWRELDPFVRVHGISWLGGEMVIEGRAYIPSIDIGERRYSSKIVLLRPRNRRRPPIILPARSFLQPDATEQSGQQRYSYDWAGFRCQISPRLFRLFGRWITGEWECYILVRGRGVWRPARIHTPLPGQAERPGFREVAPGMRLRPRWEGRNLVVGLVRVPAVLAGYTAMPGRDGTAREIELDVDLPGPRPAAAQRTGPQRAGPHRGGPRLAGAENARLILVRQGGAAALSFPASVTAIPATGGRSAAADYHAGAVRLAGIVDLDTLTKGADREQAAAGLGAANDVSAHGTSWDVYVSLTGRDRLRVAVPVGHPAVGALGATGPVGAAAGAAGHPIGVGRPGTAEGTPGASGSAGQRYLRAGREIALGRSRYGDLVISDTAPRPIVEEHAWTQDGGLQLRGRYLGPAASLGVVMQRDGSGERHRLACDHDGERFTALIDVSRMPSFGYELPLRDGRWRILFDVGAAAGGGTAAQAGEQGAFAAGTSSGPAGVEGDRLVTAGYDTARLADVTEEPVVVGAKQYRLMIVGDNTMVLAVTANRSRLERGQFNQRVLRRTYYPLKLRAPLRDAVVFVSWKGKQCTDNPLGIAAELRGRGDDREHIWVVADPAVSAPQGATVVLQGSQQYYEALARSRYLIANDDMPAHYRKRDGQIYLQTWHGTPLKRIGFDIERPQFVSGAAYLDHLAQDVAHWDLLLSQNSFSTPILRQAFRFGGEICAYGYPRNDVLSRPDAPQLAAAVRRRLGLPAGKRVVLYAPTWRDNQFYAAGRYRFDLRLDLERAWKVLGDDYVVLIRGHHHMADDVPDSTSPQFAMNVTRYPDISELFLVSDVLVTDYSSVMFDYASTGRPMLFFTYDLADYRDNVRGFYFDFEPAAPGPLLATSDEVIAAIGDIETVEARHAAAYQAFVAKFCPLDDGKAGARICDRLSSP